jgi:hypothetical protein
MSAMGPKLRRLEDGKVAFWCPACKTAHALTMRSATGDGWGYDDNEDIPTFTPSVLTQSGHYVPGHQGECWCSYEGRMGEPAPFACMNCHLFVTNGRILYLRDSSHALAGQTVDLPDFPENDGCSP